MTEAGNASPRNADLEPADWGPLSGLPGNPMMWLLILGELVVFGVAFVGFSIAREFDPVTFEASRSQLDGVQGGVNTLVLITSGWLAALSVRAKRRGASPRPALAASIAVGTIFLVVKLFEYRSKLSAGITVDTNDFFAFYYLLTGFHALHVLMGLIVLSIVLKWDSLDNLETGAAFWHMVDLIWVVLYPLIYLVR
ncbi:nitric oxide reductase NorE protein [Skermanella aerolata]|uniref:cytochrome c oxidase subunit 3 family protein n=1 Tax=Skermanella aerolata TaxID=393310 RepID=UPI003D1EE97F